MTGEERRKWLQRIRRRIAEHNDIVYMQSEQHETNCAGDCKVCQAEARYIDSELSRKAKLGEEVKLSSILSELLMDVDLTLGIQKNDHLTEKLKPSIIYIQSVSSNEDIAEALERPLDKSIKDDPGKKPEKRNGAKSGNKRGVSIDELELTIHLESAVRRYGVDNTDELYSLLKEDTVNMKKKLRGGYRFLVEKLEELGYSIPDDMR